MGFYELTKNDLDDYKNLMRTLISIDKRKTVFFDIHFMGDKQLRAFLVLHSVFRVDAKINGDFIEYYMANRLLVSDQVVKNAFYKTPPDDVKKIIDLYDLERVPFEIYPVRIEYGKRNFDWKISRGNHIMVTDFDWDVEQKQFDVKKFISKYEDIVL